MNVGDKILRLRNPEDMNSAYTLEVTDVFEVGPRETYYEITERDINYGDKKSYKRMPKRF